MGYVPPLSLTSNPHPSSLYPFSLLLKWGERPVLARPSKTAETGLAGRSALMALRVCWICGCPEGATGTGPNTTRVNCSALHGRPCEFQDSFMHHIPDPALRYRTTGLLFGAPFPVSGMSTASLHTPAPGSVAAHTTVAAEQRPVVQRSGGRASFSLNGTDWIEVDDPFASESDSGDDGATGPTAAGSASTTHANQRGPATASVSGSSGGQRASGYASAVTPTRVGAPIPMEVLAVGEEGQENLLYRPCIDCGRRTGCFCDGCLATDRFPDEDWLPGQHTPLCTVCDRRHDWCHRCRGLFWSVPPPHGA